MPFSCCIWVGAGKAQSAENMFRILSCSIVVVPIVVNLTPKIPRARESSFKYGYVAVFLQQMLTAVEGPRKETVRFESVFQFEHESQPWFVSLLGCFC